MVYKVSVIISFEYVLSEHISGKKMLFLINRPAIVLLVLKVRTLRAPACKTFALLAVVKELNTKRLPNAEKLLPTVIALLSVLKVFVLIVFAIAARVFAVRDTINFVFVKDALRFVIYVIGLDTVRFPASTRGP